ncbi:MAG: FecR family protein [Candidatus Eremiobacteraeota bacterium]|nr:FecR family protein [Candidatus Eremiobacteraeota bacterium]
MKLLSHRAVIRITIVLCLMMVLVLSFYMQSYAAPKTLAMVCNIYGRLTVIRDNQEKNAKVRSALISNDQVITDGRSQAVLLMKDNSEVKMGPNTKITIEEKNAKKGIFLWFGKVFAKMTRQDANFEFGSPHGAAAIEGTELQMEVDKSAGSILTVAEGKVLFSNSKGKVRVKGSEQSMAKSKTATISAPRIVQFQKLIMWQNQINKYVDAMESFKQAFDNAVRIKQSSGGSLIAAQQQVKEINQARDLLDSMVPDPMFQRGHNAMKGAFHILLQYLVSTVPQHQQQYLQQGQAQLQIAETELIKYKAYYQNEERKFLSEPTYDSNPIK